MCTNTGKSSFRKTLFLTTQNKYTSNRKNSTGNNYAKNQENVEANTKCVLILTRENIQFRGLPAKQISGF